MLGKGGISWNDLTPKEKLKALELSGIKNRSLTRRDKIAAVRALLRERSGSFETAGGREVVVK